MLHQTILDFLHVGFERDCYDSAMRNLADEENKLRFNNFAYAMRELVRNVLERLAPDESVAASVWFKPETHTGKPTRRQRATFAIQGGLGDDFIRKVLKFDANEMHSDLGKAINNLSKFTHVGPATFGISKQEVDAHVTDTRAAVADLFTTISDCRREIIESLWDHIDREVIEQTLRETISSVDEIATHHSVDEVYTDKIDIIAIDQGRIYFQVTGYLACEFQWGSNSDLRNDMGATAEESFPFTCRLSSPVDEPSDVEADDDGLSVDTSSWHDRIYDEDRD
jgi:hypothetical protein